MNNKKYLITDSNLFYTDEHYVNTNSGGDNAVILCNSFEEAIKEKKNLEFTKIRQLLSTEPLEVVCQYWQETVHIEDERIFWDEIKEEWAFEEIDFTNDEILSKILDTFEKKFRAKRVDFYFITEMELEK